MEKTIQITIGGAQFQITEVAYEKLSQYLESLKVHFSTEEDSAEILRDIESRIAEKLLDTKSGLITEADVSHVIADIGSASQFDSEQNQGDATPPTAKKVRKLYRDTDNAMIAGVASGLAAYFDVETVWIRLAFVASIFFGGTGIVAYLILALLIPAAKSAGQKLEMRGDAVTLDSISRLVKERVDEATKSGAPERTLKAVRNAVQAVLGIVAKLFGFVLSLGSFFAILGLTVVCAIAIANWNTPYVSAAIREIATPTIFWSALAAGYLTLAIPLMLISTLGTRLLRGKSVIPSGVGFGLVGVWCLAVIASGAIATRVTGDYYAYTAVHPDYQEISEEREVTAFDRINVQDSRVTIREGAEQSVMIRGLSGTLSLVRTSVEDGSLSISTDKWTDTCVFFCRRSHPSIVITTPDVDSISIESTNLTIEELSVTSTELIAKSSSVRMTLNASSLTLLTESSSLRGDIQADDLTLSGKDSHFSLEGTVNTAGISLSRSAFNAESLAVGDMTLGATHSYARVNATSSLTVTDKRSSSIENDGPATVER